MAAEVRKNPIGGGWWRPHRAHKVHFFGPDRRSLCEAHVLPADVGREKLLRERYENFVHPPCERCGKTWARALGLASPPRFMIGAGRGR